VDLRRLRCFVVVADERNFTRAAERLGMAQPPLSRQIRELEDELQLPLFNRETRPVTLTEPGRLLLDHAHRVLGAVAQLEDAVHRYKVGERRRFMIGFVGSTIYGPVPPLLRRFRAAAPTIDVDLLEMNTVGQIDALKDGRIDAGLGRLTFEDPAIRRQVIEHERLVAALPSQHRLAGQPGALHLADLAAETIILYPSEPRPSYADQVLTLFRDRALRPARVREARELQTALGLVSADAGVSIVPTSVQRLRRDDVVYREIADPGIVSPIILSWRANDGSPALDLLLRICAELTSERAGAAAEPFTLPGAT
jgi:DNA-binding transcriptional LysR family regulator